LGTYPRRATYDLKKSQAMELVRKIEHTRRYEPTPEGAHGLTTLLVLRDKVNKPFLAAACQPQRHHPTRNRTVIDQHYVTLPGTMSKLFLELGIAA